MKRFVAICTAFLTAALFAAAPAEVKVSAFNPGREDASAAFNAAFASGAKKIIVDNPGFDYIICPVSVPSNVEVVFMDKVTVKAKKNEFKGSTDSLFRIAGQKNVIFRGEGYAVLEMNKSDYQDPTRYRHAEWRMCISMTGSENITVKNLTLKSSGGDGIYVGAFNGLGGCKNVLIDNVICDNHHRQGISIIGAENMIIRNSRFINTSGTPPACGIDFEPNGPTNFLVNILVENCDFSNNASSGMLFHLLTLKKDITRPVSITVKNCTISNNRSAGLAINVGEVSGEIVIDNCKLTGNSSSTALKAMRGNLKLVIKNSEFQDKNGVFSILADAPHDTANICIDNVKLFTASPVPLKFECMEGFGIAKCEFNFLYGKNAGAMKKFDSAAFMKKNVSDPSKRQNIQTIAIQPKELKAANATAGKDGLKNMNIRGKFRFIQAVPAAGTYPIRFTFRQIGPAAIYGSITVRDKSDTLVETVNVPKVINNEYVYNLKANGPGVYIFEVRFGHHGVQLHADHPGQGILADQPLPLIYGQKKMYFVVPASATEVKVEVAGAGGEWVTASLLNAENKVMDKVVKSGVGKILYAKRTPTAKDEIWVLDLYGMEDHKVRLGAPCLPIFYAAPENILIKK